MTTIKLPKTIAHYFNTLMLAEKINKS